MAFFRYTATDQGGRQVSGTVQATSAALAADEVTRRGYRDVRFDTPAAAQQAIVRTKRARAADRMFLYAQAASLIRAGISPHKAFDDVSHRVHHRDLSAACKAMSAAAREGGAVSSVMEQHIDLFPHNDVAMVRSGESGGFLTEALEYLANLYSEGAKFNRRFWLLRFASKQGALTIIAFLPLPKAILDGFLRGGTPAFLKSYVAGLLWPVLPVTGVLLLIVWLITRYYDRHENARKRHALVLKMPHGIGYRAQQESIKTFLWTLRNLWSAGIAPGTAWQLAAASAPNAEYAVRLSKAGSISAGERPLSESFVAAGLFPPEYASLITTAEQSGDVVNTLGRMTELASEEFEAGTDRAKIGIWLMSGFIVLIAGGIAFLAFYAGYFGMIFDAVEQWVNE
jgi:type IV pilus assembly protein PilC